MGKDYRLNYRLDEACSRDVHYICGADVCDRQKLTSCEGKVLRCLVEKKEQIEVEGCRQEVDYHLKMEARTQELAAEDVNLEIEESIPFEGSTTFRIHTNIKQVCSHLHPGTTVTL